MGVVEMSVSLRYLCERIIDNNDVVVTLSILVVRSLEQRQIIIIIIKIIIAMAVSQNSRSGVEETLVYSATKTAIDK
jgi:hypothetical protein